MFFVQQILIFTGVLATTALLMKWRRRKEHSGVYRYPPSLPSLPLVGSLPFIRNFHRIPVFLMKKAEELGPIFTLRGGNRLVLILSNKSAIEKAYIKNPVVFSERPEFFLERLINPDFKGIIFKRNPTEWKKEKHMSLHVLKELGFGVKSTMETTICKEIEAMTDFIKNRQGNAFNPREMFFEVTSNVIMNVLVGRRIDSNLGVSKLPALIYQWGQFFSIIYDIAPVIGYLPFYRQNTKNWEDSFKKMYECLETEMAESLHNAEEPHFVQLYIQKAGRDYDASQLKYLLCDLIGSGIETVSTALQWSLVALANHPEIQKRLHAEIDAVVTGDRLPTLQDQANLPYVEATILEITRWRTLVPLSAPRETSHDSVVDGFFIPKGTMAIANLYAVHNDINIWKDPEIFRPERFLDSENNVINRDNVIPFSIGRRSCLGETLANAELFLILTSLVKRFLVLPPEGQDKVNDNPKLPIEVVLHLIPFKIRIVERK